MSAADRCAGLLVGLAAGDRIGGPTRLALRLAESLLARGRFDPADVLDRYVAWWRDGAFDTGPVAAAVLQRVAGGMAVEAAVDAVHAESGGRTGGCNPAHRSAPLAMLAALPDAELIDCATIDASLTHADPIAGRVAAVVVGLCRRLIRGTDWELALQEAHAAVGLPIESGPGSPGGYAPDVLRAAIHFVGTATGFAAAMSSAIAFAGPANYCPVVVGALAGARWGGSAIPSAELAHVGMRGAVASSAVALSAHWQ